MSEPADGKWIRRATLAEQRRDLAIVALGLPISNAVLVAVGVTMLTGNGNAGFICGCAVAAGWGGLYALLMTLKESNEQ